MTVASQVMREGTPLFWRRMAVPAQTPEQAVRDLLELSREACAAVVLGPRGAFASTEDDPERAMRLRGLAERLLEEAEDAGPPRPAQVEVVTPGGAVFAVREGGWAIVAVTRRTALAALMFYDLRSVVAGLTARAA